MFPKGSLLDFFESSCELFGKFGESLPSATAVVAAVAAVADVAAPGVVHTCVYNTGYVFVSVYEIWDMGFMIVYILLDMGI